MGGTNFCDYNLDFYKKLSLGLIFLISRLDKPYRGCAGPFTGDLGVKEKAKLR